jgi:hypothetical protein
MSDLAIHHPVGKAHAKHGTDLIEEFSRAVGLSARYFSEPSTVDAVLFAPDGVSRFLVEARTRTGQYTHAYMQSMGTYLITERKIADLIESSRILCTAGVLLVQLSDGVRLAWHVCDASGEALFPRRVENTSTQATSLSLDTVYRDNAYLPMDKAIRW